MTRHVARYYPARRWMVNHWPGNLLVADVRREAGDAIMVRCGCRGLADFCPVCGGGGVSLIPVWMPYPSYREIIKEIRAEETAKIDA